MKAIKRLRKDSEEEEASRIQTTNLQIAQSSVVMSHELLKGCWVTGELHGLAHETGVVEHVLNLGVSLKIIKSALV